MTRSVGSDASGFHNGELAVQRRAGVAAAAARLSGMLAPASLRGGTRAFLAARTFAALTARDQAGRLWISPLAGPPGFLDPITASTLAVHVVPAPYDPLHRLPAGQPVGLLVIEFATRRRIRVNGHLSAIDSGTLWIEVEQAYGNCPQYIQRRDLQPAPTAASGPVRQGDSLTPPDMDLIRQADTFLIGTTHPTHGSDASHRGGPAGFVRIEDGDLWWPDYSGNNMFNTLGNLAIDPAAALLFSDFATGQTLHLSGRAVIGWTDRGIPGDDDRTGRRVRFTTEALVAARLFPLRAVTANAAPDNPALTD